MAKQFNTVDRRRAMWKTEMGIDASYLMLPTLVYRARQTPMPYNTTCNKIASDGTGNNDF